MRVFEAPPGFDREAALSLMRLADDSEKEIRRYFRCGRLFLLQEESEAALIGQLLILQQNRSEAEIKSVSISPERQRRGLGSLLIREVLSLLKEDGVVRVTVATSTADIRNLAFYQKLGCRCLNIERDAFTPAKGYPEDLQADGLPVRDKLWFDRCL